MSGKAIDSDSISRIVMLVFGAMDHGGPYWCYVAVKPSRIDGFKPAMESKKYNLQNFEKDGYGEVIVSGEGATPPGDVTAKVAKMFNVPVSQLFPDTDAKKQINDILQNVK